MKPRTTAYRVKFLLNVAQWDPLPLSPMLLTSKHMVLVLCCPNTLSAMHLRALAIIDPCVHLIFATMEGTYMSVHQNVAMEEL